MTSSTVPTSVEVVLNLSSIKRSQLIARNDLMRYPAHNFEITEMMMVILRDHLRVEFRTFPTMDVLPVGERYEGDCVTHYEGTPMEYKHLEERFKINAYVGRLQVSCRTPGQRPGNPKALDMRVQLERVESLDGWGNFWTIRIWHHGLIHSEKPQKAAFLYWVDQRKLVNDDRLKSSRTTRLRKLASAILVSNKLHSLQPPTRSD